ncbi:MAG: MaoC family dehydratase [Chloroflexota bacterium]
MASTLAALAKGHDFPPTTFTLSPAWVDAYIEATADTAIRTIAPNLVPPMAVAALSIRALVEASPLPPGTLHAGQELAFKRAVSVGEELSVTARIASRGERAGWVLMSVDLEAFAANAPVMTGRATITFPLEQTS